LGPAEVLGRLGADAVVGLASEEAAARLGVAGRNELAEAARRPEWLRFAAQFANTLSAVLAAAAAVTVVIGDAKDTAVIGAVLVINGVVGFIQEGRAERAVDALRRMAAPDCRVRRDGVVTVVASAVLVPGDIVLLEAGEIVPADLRLLEVQGLRVQEAALTGCASRRWAGAWPRVPWSCVSSCSSLEWRRENRSSHVPHRGQPGGGGHSRGASGRGDHRFGAGGPAHSRAEGDRPAPAGGGDARLGHGWGVERGG
jgi:uncharacterized protein YjeT (DUF2065 family)